MHPALHNGILGRQIACGHYSNLPAQVALALFTLLLLHLHASTCHWHITGHANVSNLLARSQSVVGMPWPPGFGVMPSCHNIVFNVLINVLLSIHLSPQWGLDGMCAQARPASMS